MIKHSPDPYRNYPNRSYVLAGRMVIGIVALLWGIVGAFAGFVELFALFAVLGAVLAAFEWFALSRLYSEQPPEMLLREHYVFLGLGLGAAFASLIAALAYAGIH